MWYYIIYFIWFYFILYFVWFYFIWFYFILRSIWYDMDIRSTIPCDTEIGIISYHAHIIWLAYVYSSYHFCVKVLLSSCVFFYHTSLSSRCFGFFLLFSCFLFCFFLCICVLYVFLSPSDSSPPSFLFFFPVLSLFLLVGFLLQYFFKVLTFLFVCFCFILVRFFRTSIYFSVRFIPSCFLFFPCFLFPGRLSVVKIIRVRARPLARLGPARPRRRVRERGSGGGGRGRGVRWTFP